MEANLKGKWKRVGDYPPSDGQHILLKDGVRPAYLAGSTGPFNLLSPDLLWCGVDVPTEVAPPPVDEKLDAEAQVFRDMHNYIFTWRESSESHKETWRNVARKAREMYLSEEPQLPTDTSPMWRPMSELEDGHKYPVLVRYSSGLTIRVNYTYRANDADQRRIMWRESE